VAPRRVVWTPSNLDAPDVLFVTTTHPDGGRWMHFIEL
jgi:hypothetical protein